MPKVLTRFGLDKVRVERRVLPAGGSLTLDLSFPPSTNNLFANGSKGRYTTKEYANWQEENSWRIAEGRHPRVAGPVSLTFEFEDKPGRRDIDNLLKAPCDFLVKHNIIDGDHRTIVREINAKWALVSGVRITISPSHPIQPIAAKVAA